MSGTLDAQFTALYVLGQDALAYTEDTAPYAARRAAKAALRATVGLAWKSAASDFDAASFASPAALLATVDAASRLALATASLADLAAP